MSFSWGDVASLALDHKDDVTAGVTAGGRFAYENRDKIQQGAEFAYENRETIQRGANYAYENRDEIQRGANYAYENRDEIQKGANFAYENRDTLSAVAPVVYEHRDVLYENRDALYENRNLLLENRTLISSAAAPSPYSLPPNSFLSPSPSPSLSLYPSPTPSSSLYPSASQRSSAMAESDVDDLFDISLTSVTPTKIGKGSVAPVEHVVKHDPTADVTYKVVFSGSLGSGKTSIILRCALGVFPDSPQKSSVHVTTLLIDGRRVELDIIDLQESEGDSDFDMKYTDYMRTAAGFVVVCDVTSRDSFDDLTYSMSSIKQFRDEVNLPIIILGNKCDAQDRRVVTVDELQSVAKKNGCPYLDVSAQTGEGIEEAMRRLATLMERKNRPASTSSAPASASARVPPHKAKVEFDFDSEDIDLTASPVSESQKRSRSISKDIQNLSSLVASSSPADVTRSEGKPHSHLSSSSLSSSSSSLSSSSSALNSLSRSPPHLLTVSSPSAVNPLSQDDPLASQPTFFDFPLEEPKTKFEYSSSKLSTHSLPPMTPSSSPAPALSPALAPTLSPALSPAPARSPSTFKSVGSPSSSSSSHTSSSSTPSSYSSLSSLPLPTSADPHGTNVLRLSLQTPPRWQPDGQSDQCNGCLAEFSFFTRKHHCRGCGSIVCGTCSANSIVLYQFIPLTLPPPLDPTGTPYTSPLRVCKVCHRGATDIHTKYAREIEAFEKKRSRVQVVGGHVRTNIQGGDGRVYLE